MTVFLALLTLFAAAVDGDLLEKYASAPGNVQHGRYTRDIHGPELLIPRRVFEDGSFSTYSLPNFYNRLEIGERGKRSPGTADKLHLVLPFNGIDHHVELSPYHEFISPDMVVETRGAGIGTNLNEGLRFRRASNRQCHYRGTIRGHDNSRAALSLCDGVIDLFISPAAESTLESFSKWAEKMNPKDDTHPNHYDIAVLVTRYDICSEGTNCDLMGLAHVAAACDSTKAACINEDNGLLLGIVVAHEVGHVYCPYVSIVITKYNRK